MPPLVRAGFERCVEPDAAVDAFMALELRPGSPVGVSGTAKCHEAFGDV